MNKWFYVLDGERQGPVSLQKIKDLFRNEVIGLEDFVWRNGMSDWEKLRDQKVIMNPEHHEEEFSLLSIGPDESIFYIRIGEDRGKANRKDYGPFSLNILKKLLDQNRINQDTKIFTNGMKSWQMIHELEELHEALPIEVKIGKEERIQERKPFTARILFSSHNQLLDGICSDLSLGGMKVLMEHFPGVAGDIIKINVHPDDSEYHFMTSGEVVRVLEGKKGFSFRFTNLSEEAAEIISRYIETKE